MHAETANAPHTERMPPPDLARPVGEALADGRGGDARALVAGLEARDLANVIELLEPAHRVGLIAALGQDFRPDVLSELDETVRDQLLPALPKDVLAKAIAELETDDAAYLLENMDEPVRQEILAQMPSGDRAALERNLEYPQDTAGRLMQTDFVAVPPFWTVGRVIDHMREADDLPETFSDIYVVDPTYHVLGSVDLSRLLRTKRHVLIDSLMETGRKTVLATADQEEVARQFERYDLKSAPVVDADARLVGVVTVDDVVEVIEEEADEDLRRLAGVGDERITDSVRHIVPARFWWLLVNLVTAILASVVIKQFDATIEHMVALAVLMPIVASMGGNAGTQTMTVAVRALATGELGAFNTARVVLRETATGLINGLAFAVIMGTIAFLWFGSNTLGGVIAAAMVINLLAAAVAGIFIPLGLQRWGFDPAVSSTVFVTTVTDVVGFFAFLGLASLWLV
ncbi:MAG TPA: magnesium transporter [Hyphomicrobiaceae bacterium]|nr:magnesium transporter [Hyphomicrobiaceae bacterium]